MSEWARLGKQVVARRVALGHRHRESFATEAGFSSRLLGDIEKGRRSNYEPATLAELEVALGWATGSVDRVLGGGDPIVVRGLGIEKDSPAGSDAVVVQIMEVLESRFSDKTKIQMIRDVIERDFRADARADADEQAAG